jgi:predicted GNAT family N-acyltransferase
MGKVVVRMVSAPEEQQRAYSVRRQVFIVEQQIAENEEWDGLDDTALHFIALDGELVVGTARVRFPSAGYAKIERMAVLKPFRLQGFGRSILVCIEGELKKRRIGQAVLHAQVTAIPFYRFCGYEESGPIFLEADIEHVKMHKRL